MKQVIIFPLLILCSQYAYSQEYSPMAVNNATWRLGISGVNSASDNKLFYGLKGILLLMAFHMRKFTIMTLRIIFTLKDQEGYLVCSGMILPQRRYMAV